MAKGISIPIAADTKQFTSQVNSGVLKPLEGLDKALDEVGRGGEQAGKKLEKSLDAAGRETSDLKRAQQELGRTIQQSANQGTQAVALSSRQQRTIRQQAIRQAGAQARQSVAGDAAAMATSTEGALSGIGNTAGAILSSFGPIGVGIGVAVATATGVVSALIAKGSEQTKKFKERVKGLTDELINMKGAGPSVEYINGKLKEFATNTEAGDIKLKDIAKSAENARQSFTDNALAIAGNSEKLKEMVTEGGNIYKSLEAQAFAIDQSTDAGKRAYGELLRRMKAQDELNHYLITARDAAGEAALAERLYIEAGGPELAAKAEAIKNVDRAYDDAAGAVMDFYNAETGIFDVDGYIKAVRAREKAIEEYQQTLATSGLPAEAKAFLDSQGVEAAAILAQGYKNSSAREKKSLERIWTEAGRNNSGSYNTSMTKGLNKTLRGPRVSLDTPNVDVILAGLQRQLDRTGLVVKAGVYSRDGKRIV